MGHQVSLLLRKVCDYAIPEGIDYRVVQGYLQKPWRKLTSPTPRPSAGSGLLSGLNAAENLTLCSLIYTNTDRIVAHTAVRWNTIKSGFACMACSRSPICAIAAGFLAGLSILKFVIPTKIVMLSLFQAPC